MITVYCYPFRSPVLLCLCHASLPHSRAAQNSAHSCPHSAKDFMPCTWNQYTWIIMVSSCFIRFILCLHCKTSSNRVQWLRVSSWFPPRSVWAALLGYWVPTQNFQPKGFLKLRRFRDKTRTTERQTEPDFLLTLQSCKACKAATWQWKFCSLNLCSSLLLGSQSGTFDSWTRIEQLGFPWHWHAVAHDGFGTAQELLPFQPVQNKTCRAWSLSCNRPTWTNDQAYPSMICWRQSCLLPCSLGNISSVHSFASLRGEVGWSEEQRWCAGGWHICHLVEDETLPYQRYPLWDAIDLFAQLMFHHFPIFSHCV